MRRGPGLSTGGGHRICLSTEVRFIRHTVAFQRMLFGMTTIEGTIATNGGYITRAQALDCGATDRDLLRALRSGELVRIRQGIYAPKGSYEALDAVAKHVVLAKAVLAVQRGPVALCGPSAAAMYGLELYQHDLQTVHLLRLDAAATRSNAGVKHHVMEVDPERDIDRREGLAITSLARTAWDVARMSSLESAVITLDSALQLRSDLEGQLLDQHVSHKHHPGARTARLAIALADGRSANGGESYARVQFYRFQIPRPELQVPIHDRNGHQVAIVDFYWDDERHVIEFDGTVKYQKYLRPGETVSDAVIREKRREDDIRRTGRGVSRLVWSELMPPRVRQTMAILRGDLEQSRRLYVRRPIAS